MEEIKVKYFVEGLDPLCYVAGKSDWIDLHLAEDVTLHAGEVPPAAPGGGHSAAGGV